MAQIISIGLGAGAAAGLLFASILSGSYLSVMLFYMAALPILIAAIGWSHWSALIGTLTACVGLGVVFGALFALAFLLSVGLPGWWLGYLALLGRPSDTAPEGTEWYPVGRLVLWAAALGSLLVMTAIPNFGLDEETFRAGLRSAFERVLGGDRNPTDIPTNRLIDIVVMVIPIAGAILVTLTNLFNLWVAARVVSLSGRLKRPWPDLPTMSFPPVTALVFAAILAAAFLPSLIGTVSSIAAAGLTTAYAMLGFAVLHAITRGARSRGPVLAGVYAIVVAFSGWPAIPIALLGLADNIFEFRKRIARKDDPSRPQT